MHIRLFLILMLNSQFLILPTLSMEPSLVPPEVNCAPGSEYHVSARQYQGVAGIERTQQGRLWATWYSGTPIEGPNNHILLVTSDDDGLTWTEPLAVIDPPGRVRAADPVLWIDPQNRLWWFWLQSENRWDGRGGVWAVVTENPESAAPSWSAPRRICDGVMMNKPTVLTSGEWLLPVTIWEYHKTRHPAVRDEDRPPHVVASDDQGLTWKRRGGVSMPDPSCDEHMIVERRDGSLWMLARMKSGIGESFSQDKGFTWSQARKSEWPHPETRFFIRRLRSGALLMVKNHNDVEQIWEKQTGRSHLTAFISTDDGVTWQGELRLDVRKLVAYPDATESENGQIYLIYDRERKGAREILMAVFTENQVRNKGTLPPLPRLRQIISKATNNASPN
ncbi:exo-alpha-sialidase [Opitutaceae bacterium TAV4]|nr:exo-alpha-sialidase [Opitutaceae bacterium TAV4]RRK02140.1 exo-alpha-sialidase [Opitutaceae bacterium TAV3]